MRRIAPCCGQIRPSAGLRLFKHVMRNLRPKAMDKFIDGFEHQPGPRVEVFPKPDGEFVQVYSVDPSQGLVKSYYRTPAGVTHVTTREYLSEGPFKYKEIFEGSRTTYVYRDHWPPDFAIRYEELLADGRSLIQDERASLLIETIWTPGFDFKNVSPKGRRLKDKAIMKLQDSGSRFFVSEYQISAGSRNLVRLRQYQGKRIIEETLY